MEKLQRNTASEGKYEGSFMFVILFRPFYACPTRLAGRRCIIRPPLASLRARRAVPFFLKSDDSSRNFFKQILLERLVMIYDGQFQFHSSLYYNRVSKKVELEGAWIASRARFCRFVALSLIKIVY